MYMFTLII